VLKCSEMVDWKLNVKMEKLGWVKLGVR
jgi:hypothetical protein